MTDPSIVFQIEFDAVLNVESILTLEQMTGLRCRGIADSNRQTCGKAVIPTGNTNILVSLNRMSKGWSITGICHDIENSDRAITSAYQSRVKAAIDRLSSH